jgi:anti-anti-sigma factor
MELETETIPLREGAATVVSVAGELDLATSERLKQLGDEPVTAPIVVDLSNCSFLDSIALGRIVMLSRLIDAGGEPVRVAVVAPHRSQVARLLGVSGVEQALQMFETRAGALASLDARPGSREGP